MFKTVKRIIRWCGAFRGKLYIGFVFSFFSTCGQRTDGQQAQEDAQEIHIPADEAVHHADTHILQGVQAGGDGIEDISRIHLLEVAQGHPFQCLADGQSTACTCWR